MRKPGLAISFWALYTLAFTVGLPMIIYYAGGNVPETPEEPTIFTYISIGLAIVGWLLIFAFYGRFYVRSVFTDKAEILKAADEGSTIVAKITSKIQEGMMRNIAVLQLRLAFTNFSGTPVEVSYQLMDSKPQENRYEKGDILELSVDMKKKGGQIVPKGIKVARNPSMVYLYTFIFLVLIGTAVYFPLVEDWRYFVLPHPWTLIPLINLGVAIFIGFILKMIVNAGGGKNAVQMVVYGLKTTGNLVSYQQTGTFINEQPQVAFNIEFTDKQGKQHTIQTKKIVSLLDVHKLGTGPVEIMYLPDDPGSIVFYEDLSI
ncbi:hypothetical protein [Chitinophaga sancti]|uniref:DUF3592 domain-containing protein n=1 Tax=Chitinophaga sancti TaxID=1004 RepID=A0A1K1NJL5_9BACT|nr:hypothetical protein [Chitinophaga sancti]WQD63159.1 hypothetical protein U0033_02035 [Chitinophaga sancti]WQG91216.1 hypothetical protein SR876_06880 [Chitinophaga sancti]SFW35632.1 hypothetical protein SAMN05661012_01376 [Chitinophaga sancti]